MCGGGGGLASAPLTAQAMRDQVAPVCTAVNLVLLSIQCPFPFPPPISVSQRVRDKCIQVDSLCRSVQQGRRRMSV